MTAKRREAKRRALIEATADMAYSYGAEVYLKEVRFEPSKLWIRFYDRDAAAPTVAQRHKMAASTVRVLATETYQNVKWMHNLMADTVKNFEVHTTILAKLNQRAVDEARNDALVRLLESGRDNDPVFTQVASASTLAEIDRIKVD